LRVDIEHGLNLYGPRPVQLPDDLVAMTRAPVIVACPGCTTCPQGLADCWATADRIRHTFTGRDLSNVRIYISGCPNNCAQSAAAPIGLVGMIRTIDGRPAPHYRLFTGGGNGTTDKLAGPSHVLRSQDVAEAVGALCKEPQNT